MVRDELDNKFKDLEEKYKQKRHALLLVETKLEFELGSAALKYKHTMGEDKVWAILMRHREQMCHMVSESLDKGWKTWSTQATELQMPRADHENPKKQGSWFFKMDETSITTVRDDLANDIYELTTHHMKEINKMLDEFED